MNRWLRVFALLLWVALSPFAARAQQSADRDTIPSAVGVDAVILPGDQIGLRILREPDMGGAFTVAEDGTVLFPRLGAVKVVGMSAGGVQDSLTIAYREFLREPSLEVTVLRRVGIHGEVRRPDLYMVDLTTTLREVIARAGGLTEAGDPDEIEIVRDGERIELGQESAQFLTSELRSGDQIVVGRRSWLALNPAVAVSTAIGLITLVTTLYNLAKKQ